MKIRYRVLLALGISMLIAAIGVYTVSAPPMVESFANLEDQRAREDVLQVGRIMQQTVEQVHLKSVEWANLDATYQYMKDHNPTYIKSNMEAGSLKDLKIDMALILDKAQKKVYSRAEHRVKGLPLLNAEAVRNLVRRDRFLDSVESGGPGKFGIATYKGIPYAISVRPILNTHADKPSRGWIVFARYLEASSIIDLRRLTRQNVSLLSVGTSTTRTSEVNSVLSSIRDQNAFLDPINNEKLAGYTLARDFHGDPAFILKTILPRKISMQGTTVVNTMMFQFIAIGVALSLVIVFVIERFALTRLLQLSQQVSDVADFSIGQRVGLDGRDELTDLGKAINQMLSKLEIGDQKLRASEEELRAHNENLEQTVLERTQEIEHQSLHDKLTGLPNRALYMDRLAFALKRIERTHAGTAALFIDLDNFKLVNDSLGHDMGDDLLVEVAIRLSEAVRPGDTVARLGGDEFTVLLENITSLDEAIVVGQRIIKSLRVPIILGSRETFACASLGIAFTTDPEQAGDVLLKNADTAMYRAKAGGKSNYVVYDESMNDHAIERLELETDLRKALDNGELSVHFQPLVDLNTHALLGSEALARWEHPVRGFVPPDTFILIAEETGLIIPIGYWILEQACQQAKAWIEEFDALDFVMSVNLSGKQLQKDDVVERVRNILEATGLPASSLKLEITESVLMEDREDVILKMWQLKDLGLQLALDDFGTGYSSLSTLRSFPIDTLKIDRAFISRIGEEEEAMPIIEAILALAKTMHMNVTGEGVETQGQAEIIRNLGCQTGQGYLYDKPLSATEFGARFRSPRGDAERGKQAA